MASAGTLWINIAANTSRLSKGLKGARAELNRWNKYIIAGAAATTVAIGRTFEGINQSMTRSLAIMGDVSGEMRERMTRAAVDVSKVTQFSAKQAGEAYFFLASAGLNAEQSLAAMPQVAKFAQAGNFDLALATDLATDAQSALGLTSKDAATNLANMVRVTDVLVKGNILANASVQQFSESLTTKAGAALKVVGKDIEEGVAVLAALADQGVKAADAGTALSIVFRDLQTKAIQNAAAFRAANVAVFDSRGEMRNMADIVGDLEKSLLGMSDAQKKATLLQLGFSDKSVSFIQVLLGTSEKIRGYETALRSAAGTTDLVADKSLTNLQKAINRLRGAWEEMSTLVGPFLVDTLADWANWLTAVGDAETGVTRLAKAFAVVADVLHTVNLGFVKMKALFARDLATLTNPKFSRALSAVFPQLGIAMDASGGADVLHQEFARTSAELEKEFNDLLIGKTPSEKITAYFEKIKREAEKAQDSIAKTVETVLLPPKIHELFQKLGSGIASASGVLSGAFTSGIQAAARAVTGGESLGLPPALQLTQAGTAESYRQRAAIARQGEASKISKQHFGEAKKQTGLLEKLIQIGSSAVPSNIFG